MNIVFIFYDMSHLTHNYFAYPPSFLSGFTDSVHISLKIIVLVLPFAKNIILPACKIPGTKAG